MRIVIIIPARYESSRFPGKPLADILGKSLIRRVWDNCIEAIGKDSVYVATDDSRIKDHCKEQGINVLMTYTDCLTGSDRVYEASKIVEADYYINIQGDEPLIDPIDIKNFISSIHFIKDDVLINAQCSIHKEEDFFSANIPKVVTDLNNNLLYISRSPIPSNKNKSFFYAKKQVCMYGYTKKQLEKFNADKKKTPLESIEDIEILRFVELGYKVKMIDVKASSIAVDTPEDIKIVRDFIMNSQ